MLKKKKKNTHFTRRTFIRENFNLEDGLKLSQYLIAVVGSTRRLGKGILARCLPHIVDTNRKYSNERVMCSERVVALLRA